MLHRLLLIVVLVGASTSFAAAQSERTGGTVSSEIRQTAGRIALGTPVGIAFRDGHRMTGVLLDVGERGLLVQPSPSDEPQLIDYSRIEAVTERSTWYPSLGTPSSMRYGATFGLVVAALVALGWAWRWRRRTAA